MSDPRDDDLSGDEEEGSYGPEENTDETTESDAGMVGDDADVSPVPEDEE
jgi:hypothetical protein